MREHKRIIVVSAPQRSRGCAEVGNLRPRKREGEAIVIAIASPSHFSLRRLARLFEHEVGHTHGLEHGDMRDKLLWSLGPVPEWAEGAVIRYEGRAPKQL